MEARYPPGKIVRGIMGTLFLIWGLWMLSLVCLTLFAIVCYAIGFNPG